MKLTEKQKHCTYCHKPYIRMPVLKGAYGYDDMLINDCLLIQMIQQRLFMKVFMVILIPEVQKKAMFNRYV